METKRVLTVDKGKCVHCGLCIKDCIVGCIEFDGEKVPQYGADGANRCVGCQHCMAVCPAGALSFGGKNPGDSSPAGYGDPEELLTLIKSRRSVRAYKDEDLPADKLEKIRDMLAYPPTGGNRDCLHFSIVGTKAKMDEIRKASYERAMERAAGGGASPILQLCADMHQKGQDIIYRGAPSMIVASVDRSKAIEGCETADPIIALSYLDLYAQSLGLGTLWIDMGVMILEQIPELRPLLNIPEGNALGYVLLLGAPAVQYKRTVQKGPANVTVI